MTTTTTGTTTGTGTGTAVAPQPPALLTEPGPARQVTGPFPDREERSARRLRGAAIAVLVPVAIVGAVLSFDGLHSRARSVFTDPLAYGFPLLVDALILGCTLAYLAGAKVGRPRAGWRLAAHAGIAGTIALNAAAATAWVEVPWHITAPIVWSVLVELTGKELLGEWSARHQPVQASIPARLWVTAPVESLRTWLRIARRLDGEQTAARLDVGVHAAAAHALALAVPGWRNRRVRRILRRQLRAGSLSPLAILAPLGWTDDTTATLTHIDGPAVLRAALRDAIRAAAGAPTPTTAEPAAPAAPADPAVPPAATVSAGATAHTLDDDLVVEAGDDEDAEGTACTQELPARDDDGQTYSDAMAATYGGNEPPHYEPGTVDVRVSAVLADDVRGDEDGPDDDGPGPRGGGAPIPRDRATSGQSGQGSALATAVELVQADPQLTGAQMSARMAARGHTGRHGLPVSDRTGRRWIAEAMTALEFARRERLQVVGGRQ